LQGARILTGLSQQSQFNYSQTFETGTNYAIGLSANRASTNSSFVTLNPSIFSSLNFGVSQPLLRHRGLFANRAPILIARRSMRMSRATFEAQVSDSLSRAVNEYWDVVQGRENLSVLRESLKQAQASYDQNKRALELGALPPLDIYRSESQVATRRLAVIQAEYALKQTEDQLRRTIGADLDPTIAPLDLELTESAEPPGDMFSIDAQSAIERALAKRPELEALRQQLAIDDTTIRLAHNGLQPDLNLTGSYSSSGLAGNDSGLAEALNQIGNFKFPTYGFSLQLRLPIRNRSAEADLGTSEVSKQRDLYSMRRSEQAARQDALNAVHQLEQAKLSIAAGKIARELARKNLEAEQRKYELGAQTIFFVLDAQTQLAQAEVNLVQSQINYQRALTAVGRATGELLERHHVQIAEPH
jgi:outer membrane protein